MRGLFHQMCGSVRRAFIEAFSQGRTPLRFQFGTTAPRPWVRLCATGDKSACYLMAAFWVLFGRQKEQAYTIAIFLSGCVRAFCSPQMHTKGRPPKKTHAFIAYITYPYPGTPGKALNEKHRNLSSWLNASIKALRTPPRIWRDIPAHDRSLAVDCGFSEHLWFKVLGFGFKVLGVFDSILSSIFEP